MGKVAGVAAVMAMASAGMMTVLTQVLGSYAEVSAVALMGAGLLAAGQLLGRTSVGAEGMPHKQTVNG